MTYVLVIVFILVLMILHELGHIIAAKFLGLEVKKVGFQMKPYPHFYVAAQWPRTNRDRYIYLFSGMVVTLILFLICLMTGMFYWESLYIAFCIQIVLETNPFYSDMTILVVTNQNKLRYGKNYGVNYKGQFSNYQFTNNWYVHFAFWTFLILFLIKLNHLI